MFKKLSILLIGVVIGALIFGSTSIFASESIKLIVNGKAINSDVPPQVINGRTMVPARFLAEALGATVIWDDSQNAVIVTSQVTKNTSNNTILNTNGIDLTSLDYIGTNEVDNLFFNSWEGSGTTTGSFTLAGKKYKKGIGFDYYCTEPYIAYNLNKSYTRLTGYFGADDSAKSWQKMTIYGDGRIIFESSKIETGGVPDYLDVDVTGVNQLKIQFSSGFLSNTVFADPKLY